MRDSEGSKSNGEEKEPCWVDVKLRDVLDLRVLSFWELLLGLLRIKRGKLTVKGFRTQRNYVLARRRTGQLASHVATLTSSSHL